MVNELVGGNLFEYFSEFAVSVLFGSHASDALKISVEGCGFGEAQHIGCFLKCVCGMCFNEVLGLCRHVLLYPFDWRETVGGCADDLAEMRDISRTIKMSVCSTDGSCSS